MSLTTRATLVLSSCLLFLVTVVPSSAVQPYWGLRLGTPLGLSVSGGVRFSDPGSVDFSPGLEAELGSGGGRVMLGLDNLGQGFGAGVKAGLLRTWLEPIDLDEDQTYLGLVFQIGYDQLFGELSGYRRIEGDDDEWLTSIGVGFRM